MNNNPANKKVMYLGIGGIGMSAIARYHHACGWNVAGYDKTPSSLTQSLQDEGIDVFFEDQWNLVPEEYTSEDTLVVYTPAIPKTSEIFQKYLQGNYRMIKRAAALGEVTANSLVLAVGGTHGKTTTSCLVSHLLHETGISFTAFLGGIASNFQTNYIAGDIHTVVVEADEFDRSFLHLQPSHAVITSTDADHLDIYGEAKAVTESFQLFADLVPIDGKIWAFESAQICNQPNVFRYGSLGDASAQNIIVANGSFQFDYVSSAFTWEKLTMGLPGFHNIFNAVAAISLLKGAGFPIQEDCIRQALLSFKGVSRRFDQRIISEKVVYIDDYAHHPTEIKALIESVRALYPNKKITGIFQPHLFSRTRDFMEGFAEELSKLDRLILLEIYPARELPMLGINSKALLDLCTLEHKSLVAKEEVLQVLNTSDEIIITIGAGDIDRLVGSIETFLKGAYS
jgi:UDP-N-acetylmuramate--alanine ligase